MRASNGPHELKIVVRGEKNPLARQPQVRIDSAQFSDATRDAGFGSGGGPGEDQRLIFGYTGRRDYVDSQDHTWRPGTEFVVRLGFGVDTVARCWWTRRRSMYIGGTRAEEIYRYGVHAPEFWVNLTVAPGQYTVRLHWADTPETPWVEREGKWEAVSRPTTVAINGARVIEYLNVRKEVGTFKAFLREFPGIQPRNRQGRQGGCVRPEGNDCPPAAWSAAESIDPGTRKSNRDVRSGAFTIAG